MKDESNILELSFFELREVARYAATCARPGLEVFETEMPEDFRPRAAVEAAEAFASGAKRGKVLRDCAWAAQRAAKEVGDAGLAPASEAARAALAAAGAAFLHPISKATQVKHILGSAAHTARAFELRANGVPEIAGEYIELAGALASPALKRVLRRYPPAPLHGGRVGELIRRLDSLLR